MIKVHWWDHEPKDSVYGEKLCFQPIMPEPEIEAWCLKMIECGKDLSFHTYNELIPCIFKMFVAEEKLKCEELELWWNNDKKIEVNKYGAIVDWPDGFMAIKNRIAERTLIGACKQRKRGI